MGIITPGNIPVTGYDPTALGTPVLVGHNIALCMPIEGYLLLSGGSSVRTNVTTILSNETWTIYPNGQSTITYAQTIGFQMPQYHNDYLSGGSSVRTNTNTFLGDEQWQILNAQYAQPGQPILYGSFVILAMTSPGNAGLLLSGGSSVRSNVLEANVEEVWQILKIPASSK